MFKNIAKLNKRQEKILSFLEKNDSLQIGEILDYLSSDFEISRMTVSRDLKKIVKLGILNTKGAGRNTYYSLISGYKLLKNYDIDEYFKTQALLRKIQEKFNPEVFEYFNQVEILSSEELLFLDELHIKNETRILKFGENNETLMKRELERLIIDLAWKSSQIEGNTYTLFETEALIKEHIKAKGKTEKEAIMILNHKKAVDFIMQEQKYFQNITLQKIQELHSILIADLNIQDGWRLGPVGITGTKYTPLFNEADIREVMNDFVKTINKIKHPFVKALATLALIAYIQPFQDGNKRTSRLLANAILYAYGYSMLSYSSADVVEYKKAIVLFYEQNSTQYLKEIFISQYKFAVETYFRV